MVVITLRKLGALGAAAVICTATAAADDRQSGWSTPLLAAETASDASWLQLPETAAEQNESFVIAARQNRLKTRKRISDPSLPGAGSYRRYTRTAFKWFWNEVSPSKAAASAKRWASVMKVIDSGRRKGKAVFGSRTTAQRILQNYRQFLEREAKRRNVSVPFLIAVIAVESNGNPKARSPVGAQGLMQLMPFTAARFGVSNSYAPSQNIRGGTTYLDWLLKRFRNDAVLALAGYNAGEGAVDKHRGVPPYKETRDYVAKVAGAFSAARALCKKPPNSPRDPCELR
ncbi:MAG: lytic transglycosylase domain-containing protein [Pseudomonadota bacterium]